MPRSGWLASPTVQTVVVAWELLLGTWLLSGTVPVYSWLAALGTFLAFAALSGYYGVIGQASCGCFGTIQASPWHVFSVDVVVLLTLAILRPAWDEAMAGLKPFALRVVTVGIVAVAIIGIVALAGSLAYGSVGAALAKLRGRSLDASVYVDFGTALPGKYVEQIIEVKNYTDQPVRLIGGTSDCSCVTTSNMPVVIPAGETTSVMIKMKVPSSESGQFTRHAELWTDCDRQRKLWITLGCYVAGEK